MGVVEGRNIFRVPPKVYTLEIPMNTPATRKATTSTRYRTVSWSNIRLSSVISGVGIEYNKIIGAYLVVQLSVSDGEGYVDLYDKTRGVSLVELTTTSTKKSNWVVGSIPIDQLREGLRNNSVFILRYKNSAGEYTYVGKAYLLLFVRW